MPSPPNTVDHTSRGLVDQLVLNIIEENPFLDGTKTLTLSELCKKCRNDVKLPGSNVYADVISMANLCVGCRVTITYNHNKNFAS